MCGFSLSTKNKKSGGGRVLTQEYPILHKFGLPYQKVQTLGRGVRIISQQDFLFLLVRTSIKLPGRNLINNIFLKTTTTTGIVWHYWVYTGERRMFEGEISTPAGGSWGWRMRNLLRGGETPHTHNFNAVAHDTASGQHVSARHCLRSTRVWGRGEDIAL